MRKPRYNPLVTRVKANSLPKSVTPRRFLLRLLKTLDERIPLPAAWDVELFWWNPATKVGRTTEWQSGEFLAVLEDSSEGFAAAVSASIEKRIPAKREPAKRKRKRRPAPRRGSAAQPRRSVKGRFAKFGRNIPNPQIEQSAFQRMKQWAEDTRNAQDKWIKRGDSAYTTGTNTIGTEEGEEMERRANEIRSSGAKESGPLASFKGYTPGQLARAIEKNKTGKGRLFQRIKRAFLEVAQMDYAEHREKREANEDVSFGFSDSPRSRALDAIRARLKKKKRGKKPRRRKRS